MSYTILPFFLAGLFLVVLLYVAWMKIYEHLLAHRDEHQQRSHHLVEVRKIQRRKEARTQPAGEAP